MKICIRVLLALLVVVFLVGAVEAASYKILHKEGAVYDSVDGWVLSTPPYYAGNDWAVDFAYTPDGLVMLHKDGSIWNQTDGWILTTPPYYPGSAYARAIEVGELTVAGTSYPHLTVQGRGASGLAYGIKFKTDTADQYSFLNLLSDLMLIDDIHADTIWFVDALSNPPEFLIEVDTTINGDLDVTGTKSFVMPDPTDPTKEIYYACLEGPESGTYVRGTAEVVDGTAVITLPEHFAKVTADEKESLTVTVTPYGAPLQLYVVEKGTSQIVVGEAAGKSGTFDYLVQGKRKGYEDFQVVRDVDIERAEHREAVRDAAKNQ
jgi:hypothetical protein